MCMREKNNINLKKSRVAIKFDTLFYLQTDKSIMKIKSCLSVSNPMAQCNSTRTTNNKSNEFYETDSQMKKTTTAS